MAEKLLPCPFCNSTNIDPEGWKSSDGTSGPACDDCCGSANSIVEWNTRPREGSPPPAVEGGWRDIESAPKDGTRFLTFDDYYGVRMGRAFIRADHDDWLSYVDCNGNSSKGGIRASHWMPLPAAPVDGGENA